MAIKKRTLSQDQIQQEYLLVEAAKKNPRRFGVLYERYYEAIFLFVYKRIDDEAITADVTSQVFLKAMLNLKKYQFKGVPFSAWLYRIASNEVNQHFRKNKGNRTISLEATDLKAMAEEGEIENNEENVQRMLAAFQHLSPEDVQMIEFRFFEKLPFKEIASIYDITENNAKVRMYRLLGRLKKIMEKQSTPKQTMAKNR